MQSKYIDLVINRLTQAKYDELKLQNKISEEELYVITDHDDLFYYKTELYTRSEIESKLTSVMEVLRGELDTFKTDVAGVYATKQELSEFSPVSANPELEGSEEVLESITIDGVDYQVLPEGSIEFNTEKSTDPNALDLGSIKVGNDIWNLAAEVDVDLSNYYTKTQTDNFLSLKQNTISFNTERSDNTSALTLGSLVVNNRIWNLPVAQTDGSSNIDLANYYTKNETNTLLGTKQDSLISGASIKTLNGESLLGSGNIEIDLSPYATRTWVEGKGYLTQHQDLSAYALKTELFSKDYNDLKNKPTIPSITGLASESYVNTKIADLVGSAPETLDTLQEVASALKNQDDVITALETTIGSKASKSDLTALQNTVANKADKSTVSSLQTTVNSKADSSALTALETKLNNKVDSLDVYTKEEIDSMDFSNVSANPTTSGDEDQLTSISIKGQTYSVIGNNTLSLSNVAVAGGYNLRSLTINGDVWNIVGSSTGGSSGGIGSDDIAAELENYYTKEEVDNVISESITDIINGAPETYDTFKEIANYIESDLSNAAAMLASINNKAEKSDVYTKAEANAKFVTHEDIPESSDMSNYYTKAETEQVIESKIDAVTGLDNYYDKAEIDSKIETVNATKQDILVSGRNIKTINGQSILGEGNIEVAAAGGSGSGSGSGSTVIANPELDGTEEYLESIQIEDTKYSLFGMDFTLSESPVEGAMPLKNIKINDDNWSVETGSHVSANVELKGQEQYLESIEIDSVKYSIKGEEMVFSESPVEGSTVLNNIQIGEDNWSTGYSELLKKIAELEARIEALEGGN